MPKTVPSKTSKIFAIASIIFLVVVLLLAIGGGKKESQSDNSMSIVEAQTKCTLMEESDMVNLMDEPFNSETRKKAGEHCRSLWDTSENPENTEDKFIEMVTQDWETQKTVMLEGYTLEELYNESQKLP